jgi:hypothetical protein
MQPNRVGVVTDNILDRRAISPELALVDPELARALRAELCAGAEEKARAEQLKRAEHARLAPAQTSDDAVAHERPEWLGPPSAVAIERELVRLRLELDAARRDLANARRKLVDEPRFERQRTRKVVAANVSGALNVLAGFLLFGSLLMNLGFIGFLVAPGSRPTMTRSPATTIVGGPVEGQQGAFQAPIITSSTTRSRRRILEHSRARSTEEAAKRTAEREIGVLLIKRWSTRLPPALRDRRTGLLKNNVKIVCMRRPSTSRHSFTCLVLPPQASARTPLYVAYRVGSNGRLHVKWLGFRKP